MNKISTQKAFIFLGAPGAGKGTFSQIFVRKFGWVQLSTGDLCRKHIAQGTDLGKQIDFAIKSGKLVDDVIIIDMVSQWIDEHIKMAPGIIFDGFPRTLVQARLFLELIQKRFSELVVNVIQFEIPDSLIIERLSARKTCSNKQCQAIYSLLEQSTQKSQKNGICDKCGSVLIQREDDKSETIAARLQIYHQHAQPLLDFYKNHNFIIHRINAQAPLQMVQSELEMIAGI